MARKKANTSGWTPKRLKSLRERLGLTQAEIAERVGFARRTWMYWEGGKQVPSTAAARLITLLAEGTL